MSTKALNQFLGRSKIDPAVLRAFYAGRIVELLSDYDFDPELRTELAALQAATFAQFAELAYHLVMERERSGNPILPDPTEGLTEGDRRPRKERVA